MRKLSLIPLLLLLLVLPSPVSAECKYFKNADGFPLGIIPTPSKINTTFADPTPQNKTFLLYIEAEAGTTTSLDCRVSLEIHNASGALKVELSNYSLETGLGFTEKPIIAYLTPINLVNFPDEIRTYIKITDVDDPDNYAMLPVIATFKFDRQKPKPTIKPTATRGAGTGSPGQGGASQKPTAAATNSSLIDLINKVEDSNSKYLIAVVAFFFLGALLWMGFSSMQRD
ncbi:MAG TPA: hypothetical protein VJI13_06430 [Candidatus Norongarragalinales archaeon]|nr:hypothetical protein [Candidatus Norongarragalinales archaeon]